MSWHDLFWFPQPVEPITPRQFYKPPVVETPARCVVCGELFVRESVCKSLIYPDGCRWAHVEHFPQAEGGT